MGRRIAGTIAGLALVTGFISVTAAQAGASTASAEQDFVSRINAERTSRGLRALAVRSSLNSSARRQSARMADAGSLFHNSNLANEIDGWTRLGENVGMGPSVATVHDSFMASSTHRANILGRFNSVGVGVVQDGAMLYVTEVFAQLSTTTSSTSYIRTTSTTTTSKTSTTSSKPRTVSLTVAPAPRRVATTARSARPAARPKPRRAAQVPAQTLSSLLRILELYS